MNAKALTYLVLASAVLAGSFFYMEAQHEKKAPSETAPATPTQEATASQRASTPLPMVTIQNGQRVGSPVEVKTQQGQVAQFQIKSNTNTELHVHGLDIEFPIKAGEVQTITLPTLQTGQFEMELHPSEVSVGVLEVYPK